MKFSENVALGTKVFKRTQKLENLFDSIENSPVEKVYVADDGDSSEREHLYDENVYSFDLTVIDLEFNAGLGKGRAEIVQQLEEDYLLLVDSDHLVPHNVETLYNVLESDTSIGGVGGLILENGNIGGMYHDIYEERGALIRDVREEKNPVFYSGIPFIEFDFIPNAALFRKECIKDYTWDERYVIEKEHIDFYVGHYKTTNWKFGACPSVIFPHDRGGSSDYIAYRENPKNYFESTSYFLDKWGYENEIVVHHWMENKQVEGFRDLLEWARDNAPHRLRKHLIDFNKKYWYLKWKLCQR